MPARSTHGVSVTCGGSYTVLSSVMRAQQTLGYCQPAGTTSVSARQTSSIEVSCRLISSWTL